VKDNEYLDEFILNGIPKKKKGEICLSVTFSIDENQILSVKGYIAERNIKKEIVVERNRKKYLQNSNFSSLNSSEVNNKKLKTIKEEIIRYSQKFKNASESSEKLMLIKKYDEAIIYIIKLLEEKDPDSYFNFIEKLFQSYSYIINSELLFNTE
jgi:molecular chaperone DnaK (HSP70)